MGHTNLVMSGDRLGDRTASCQVKWQHKSAASVFVDAGGKLCACKLGKSKGCLVHSRVIVPADSILLC